MNSISLKRIKKQKLNYKVMSIYLYRNSQQEGPFEEAVIREWLQNGNCSPNTQAIRQGMSEWQPLSHLLDLPMPPVVSLPTGRLQNEVALLDQYSAEIGNLTDNLSQSDTQTAKRIQTQLEQKMQIYWKQIYLVKTQFPTYKAGSINEARFYGFQALILFFSSGLMRRTSDRSESLTFGLATGLIAKQQEKKNAQQAITLLDKAISLYDFAIFHMTKAEIFRISGDNQAALYELNYIISNFADDEIYMEARQIKDEIENPPKNGMCFVATAAYGSPIAPEVILLSRFRDEVLLNSRAGIIFVKTYYYLSPPFAALISKTNVLRTLVRKLMLSPAIHLLKKFFRIKS